jgi:hypothetical protein
MVDIVQKLPYGIENGATSRCVEIKCKCCNLVNDVEVWMLGCFVEMNCAQCGSPLDLAKLRKK